MKRSEAIERLASFMEVALDMKSYKITINELSEEDMRDILHQAITLMGISPGEKIPWEIVDLRERIIQVMFGDKNEN